MRNIPPEVDEVVETEKVAFDTLGSEMLGVTVAESPGGKPTGDAERIERSTH